MVAPVDAKAELIAGDERFTLRMSMRTLALAKKAGVNLMKGGEVEDLDAVDMATVLRCLATPDHPEISDDDAFALLIRYPDATSKALGTVMTEFNASAGGGESDGAGHPPKPAKKARTS